MYIKINEDLKTYNLNSKLRAFLYSYKVEMREKNSHHTA
jgi:hypothetical protein